MSYLITMVRREGHAPRTVSAEYDDDQARAYAEALAAMCSRVTLAEVDGNGMHTVVARWKKGKRSVQNGATPEPVTIEGEMVESHADEELDPEAVAIVAAEHEHESGDTPVYNAYCVKCKQKRDFYDGHVEETANGRRMAKGHCPVCGTKVNAILKNVPLSEDFHTPDDEPEADDQPDEEPADEPAEPPQDEPDTDEDAGAAAAADDLAETVTEAIVESVPEGATVPEIAEAVNVAAVEFSHDATEAIESEAEEKPAPRKRAPRKAAAKKATAKESTSKVTDADIEEAKAMQVANCPHCHVKVPFKVAGSTGIRYFPNHPDRYKDGTATGNNCKGSMATVEDDML